MTVGEGNARSIQNANRTIREAPYKGLSDKSLTIIDNSSRSYTSRLTGIREYLSEEMMSNPAIDLSLNSFFSFSDESNGRATNIWEFI